MVTALFHIFNIIGSEWVMWILMGLSVISLAVVFERYRNLGKQERIGAFLWKEQIEGWMKSGKIGSDAQLLELSKKYPCLESGLLEVLAVSQQQDKSDLELLMASYLGRKRVDLDKNLSFLGTLGSNAPFIGLFGTVLGIIRAFHTIGSTAVEGAGAQSVTLGLSEALVATAVGLLVAIPAVVFFNHFQKKIKVIVARAESLGLFVISSKGRS
jgi:biopolymer transport protein ExbB/TolQ